MVSLLGHVALALLFALPAWVLWSGRASVVFIGLTAMTAMLPDIDLVLSELFPSVFRHHGVTHTVTFVVLVSVVAGAIVSFVFGEQIDEWTRGERFTRQSLFVFATSAFVLGGVAHLCGDALSAPDISTPIMPFWPFLDLKVGFDVVHYEGFWINQMFMLAMGLLHLALGYVLEPFEHRYRVEDTPNSLRR